MTTNLVSQAATMELGGVPNDVVHNLNPFTLIMYVNVPVTTHNKQPKLTKQPSQLHPHLRQVLLPLPHTHGIQLHAPEKDPSRLRLRRFQHGRRSHHPTLRKPHPSTLSQTPNPKPPV